MEANWFSSGDLLWRCEARRMGTVQYNPRRKLRAPRVPSGVWEFFPMSYDNPRRKLRAPQVKCYGMSSELSYGTSTEISYGTSKNSRDYKSNNLNYCLQWLQYIPTRIIAKTSSTISLSLIIIGLKSQQLRSIRKKRRRQYRSSVQNASCQMDVRKIHGITCTKHLLRVLHPGRLAIPGTGYRYTYGLHPTPTGYMGGLHANRQ